MAYFDKYGVEFSDDRKTLIRCPKNFTGSYSVPNGVEDISNFAYKDCKNITEIIISNSVVRIGEEAFYGCTCLNSIVIEYNVKHIGGYAFWGCEALTYVHITYIKSWCEICFDGPFANPLCYAHNLYYNGELVKTLSIPDFTSIRNYAFQACESLTCVIIPSSCPNIGNYAFSDCSSLSQVAIGNNGITSIGSGAFSGCSSLTSIIIPDSVNDIGDSAFRGCTQLAAVFIPDNITNISRCSFCECTSLISVIIPNSVIHIDSLAFSGCKTLKTVILPNSIKNIGSGAFKGCCRLKSIIIPQSVTNIGFDAFRGCSSLISISIPNNVINVDSGAFSNCRNLRSVTINTNFIFNKTNAYFYNLVGVFGAQVEEYNIIDECITSIGAHAFRGSSELTSIIIPNSIISIGDNAFEMCTSLQQVVFPNNITNMGDNLFTGCSSLQTIYVPKSKKEEYCALGLERYRGFIKEIENKLEKSIEDSRGEKQIEEYQQEVQVQCLQLTNITPTPTTKYIFFDTECNGLPKYYNLDVCITSNWPRLIQLAWVVTDEVGNIVKRQNYIIKPNGFVINDKIAVLTSINTVRAQREGVELVDALSEFMADIEDAQLVIGHNIDFDMHIVGCELFRENMNYNKLMTKPSICTMQKSTNFCAIPSNGNHAGYKWPKLEELHQKLFGTTFSGAHDAMSDVEATRKCYFELKKKGIL